MYIILDYGFYTFMRIDGRNALYLFGYIMALIMEIILLAKTESFFVKMIELFFWCNFLCRFGFMLFR